MIRNPQQNSNNIVSSGELSTIERQSDVDRDELNRDIMTPEEEGLLSGVSSCSVISINEGLFLFLLSDLLMYFLL